MDNSNGSKFLASHNVDGLDYPHQRASSPDHSPVYGVPSMATHTVLSVIFSSLGQLHSSSASVSLFRCFVTNSVRADAVFPSLNPYDGMLKTSNIDIPLGVLLRRRGCSLHGKASSASGFLLSQ